MSSSKALLSVRLVLAVAGAALIGGSGLATPAAAHASVDRSVAAGVLTMSAGRLGATTAAVLGLIGVVVGGLALARPTSRVGTGSGRLGAVVALAAGLVGMALGGLVVATSDSGIGTGNGRGGAYVALVVGLVGVVLGGLALARSRRTGRLTG
ncbi:hypothetical protein FHS29_006444 [Saccharothrix tamanrassetensis]|uniref:Uncharacterized protein n=1 Tax=Saccharothrix tamanrassetensis TaxID=1051531 RepID=A0A841CSI5_9PSEU|nr:DUF6223 family protein [Saccharothrix tamanrassetensis]MBB5959823.1 hypothetical protein [Saccharothrix tamanrassetensis]